MVQMRNVELGYGYLDWRGWIGGPHLKSRSQPDEHVQQGNRVGAAGYRNHGSPGALEYSVALDETADFAQNFFHSQLSMSE